jgi:hypothetical protein
MLPGVQLQCVGICVKPDQPQVADRVAELEEWLRKRGIGVLLDAQAASWVGRESMPLEELAGRVDLLIVLGGDGTLLAAARAVGERAVPLLPIYAGRLGAAAAVVGNYLALAFLFLAIGTWLAGWLAAKLQRRRLLLILVSLMSAPLVWSMGQVMTLGLLVGLTALVWFSCGACIVLISVLAGLNTTSDNRGKVFGLLTMTIALAGVVAGLTSGPVVDRWGIRRYSRWWLPHFCCKRVWPVSCPNRRYSGQQLLTTWPPCCPQSRTRPSGWY